MRKFFVGLFLMALFCGTLAVLADDTKKTVEEFVDGQIKNEDKSCKKNQDDALKFFACVLILVIGIFVAMLIFSYVEMTRLDSGRYNKNNQLKDPM
jgi:hypothetical protein